MCTHFTTTFRDKLGCVSLKRSAQSIARRCPLNNYPGNCLPTSRPQVLKRVK